MEVTVGADGSAQLATDTTYSGVFAVEGRNRYMADASRKDRVARDLVADFGPVEIGGGKGVEVNDLEDIEQKVVVKARGKAASLARREGDTLSMPVGAAAKMVTDYAGTSTRQLDVVLPALSSRDDEWTVKVPAGMRVVRAPTPAKGDSPFGSFAVEVEASAGKVVVRGTMSLKKARITPGEYPAFRAWCEQADRAFGQRLVLGK